ncbi:hypothetical protein D3C87_472530 [compost metagenome]
MKTKSFLILYSAIILIFVQDSFAQTKIVLDEYLGKNGVFKNHTPTRLQANSNNCFNLKIWYKGIADNGTVLKGFFYLNTANGMFGYSTGKNITTESANPNSQKLNFTISDKFGKSATYFNESKGRKWMMANNKPTPQITSELWKKHGSIAGNRRRFTDLSLATYAYYSSTTTANPKMYIYMYNGYFDNDGKIKNYIGMYGIGFYQINESTYLGLSREQGSIFMSIEKIEKVDFCFNGAGFKDFKEMATTMNDEVVNNKNRGLEMKEQNLNESDGLCSDLKKELIALEKSINKKMADANSAVKSGRSNIAMMAAASDPKDQIIKHRLEFDIKKCEALHFAGNTSLTAAQRSKHSQNAACCLIKISFLRNIENKMTTIEVNNRSNTPKAAIEKNTLYLQSIKQLPTLCN